MRSPTRAHRNQPPLLELVRGPIGCALVGITAAFAAGWITATRRHTCEPDQYWHGFADGELHAQLTERVPSNN